MSAQPEALRLADLLEDWAKDYATTDFDCDMGDQAAAELRRLHEVNQELLDALKVCLVKGAKWHPCDPVVTQAHAAIAKATGGNYE